jgi:hypothetical protein
MILFVVVIVVVAFYRQWVVVESPTVDKSGDESTRLNIKIDQKKARDDIQSLIGSTTLDGVIQSVNLADKQLDLKVGNTTHSLRVTDATIIERGDQRISFESLQIGEKAAVKTKEDQNARIARSIAVKP